MVRYGITWWGEQWLNALSHIDYSNRLPRGRNYANKGAVKEISFKKNIVSAKVQGTRPAPYKVTLKIPEFTKDEIASLTGEVLKNPLLISRLLNRELPRNLNEIANKHGIRIFPEKWNDLDMHCSCPDWAVPCKHLAAVINLIANEIDKNPFLIFKLHAFDIIAELNQRGMESVEETINIPKLQSLAETDAPTVTGTVKNSLAEKNALTESGTAISSREETDVAVTAPGSPALWDSLNLALVPAMRENLLTLLNERPVFYSTDFKGILDKIYRKTARYTSRELIENYDIGEKAEVYFEKYDHVEIRIRQLMFYSNCTVLAGDEVIQPATVRELMGFLRSIPPKYVNRLHDHLLLLYFVYHFTLKLAGQSALTPQLVILPDETFAIRWIPAMMNEQVKSLYTQLVDACPSDLVMQEEAYNTFTDEGAGNSSVSEGPGKAAKERAGKTLLQEEQINALVSLFYKQIIRDCGIQDSLNDDPVPVLFTENFSYPFDQLGEQEVPGSIQRWLEKFYLSHSNFSPGLKISPNEDKETFSLEVFVENRKKALQGSIALEEFLQDRTFSGAKFEVLRRLEMLTGAYKGLEHIIATSGRYIPSYSSQEFAEIIFRILPLIRLYGIPVILPDELKHMVRPRLSMSLSHNNSQVKKSFLTIDKLLDFQYKIALGDVVLEKDEFFNLVKGLSGIVLLKQQYVYLDSADLKALMEQFSKQEALNRHQLLQAAITGEYQGAKILIDKQTQALIDALMQTEKIDLPAGLNAELRPYQQRGYYWLCKNAQLGFGSIIADDMGLGKTLQVISLLLRLKEEDPAEKKQVLIVVPTTLITNWLKEFEKFAPVMTCSAYHGPGRELDTGTDVVLTSYGVTRSDQEKLSKIRWKAVVIDEAQNIKNAGAAQTRAVKKLKSEIRIAMSGTPVENRLSEYWSIFDFTNHGYLGNQKQFRDRFAIPIELSRDQKKLNRFLKITAPFIIRRVKSDKSVISDLPDKVENDLFASLEKEQAAIYQNVLNMLMGQIEEVPADKQEGMIRRKGLVLKMITALKQVCNHPSQYLKKKDYAPELSGKAGVFARLIENILENNDKVLVFTQYREMGTILQQMIRETFDVDSLFLHGGTPRKQRDAMVEQFQEDPHQRVFILSLKAGGTGLNLTAANHVIHYDLWWNPAVEAQATDRAYRIGQERKVMVHRMITKGTFEERINEMLKDKKQLADLTVTSGEKWIGDLSNRELKTLFRLGG